MSCDAFDYRMLVIEDDDVERQGYRRTLRDAGLRVQVVEAHDGRSGLDLAIREAVDCVLLDYRLPDVSGLELLNDLLRPSPQERPPVIVVTGEGDERVAAEAIKLGAYDYLTKRDLTPGALARAVRHAVEIATQQRRRLAAERALFAEKERAQVILRAIVEGVVSTDAAGLVVFLNPAAEALTGWSLNDSLDRPLAEIMEIVDETSGEPVRSAFDLCRANGEPVSAGDDVILKSRHGQRYALHQSVAPIRGLDDKISGYVVVFSDVTESRMLAKRLSYQATHDSLTGLVNRAEFERRLDRLLAPSEESPSAGEHAVCFLDLDHFKVVNDSCGHLAGDELLQRVAEALRSQVRSRDTVARLGGDEFGILMEHCSIQQASRVGESLRQAVAGIRFARGGRVFRIGASIGLAAVSPGSTNRTEVLRAADHACYSAKEAGRDRVRVFDRTDSETRRRLGDMECLGRLQHALQEGRFHFRYQPIVPLLDEVEDHGEHFELLLRLQDDSGALVSPGGFLAAAERYGMATMIDRWVVTRALAWLRENPTILTGLYLCNINLSGRSLTDADFLGHVLQVLAHTQIPPGKICFEITETSAIASLDSATQFIAGLSAHGCSFALDDFGSGLSSFGYLRSLAVDFVKIDGSLVHTMVTDPASAAMVASIAQIGRAMGKRVVAEWVEDDATVRQLKALGVHYAQGHWIASPRDLHGLAA